MPSNGKPLHVVRLGAVALSILLSVLVGFMAQAASPDYRRLFLAILPLAVINMGLLAFILVSKQKGKIWLAGVPGVLGFASYIEMACRVFLSFRLL